MSLFYLADPNLQVLLIRYKQYYTRTELKCHSICRLPDSPSFIWYKNGQKIEDETSYTYKKKRVSTDSWSCALKGFEHHPSPSVCEFKTQSPTNIPHLVEPLTY